MTFLSTLKKTAQVAGDVLTTKGDILSRSTSALGRLGVGSNGKVLTAKSSEALGISWETPTEGVTASSTTTFTNKTIDQDATGNSITNIADASIKSSAGIAQSKISSLVSDLGLKSPKANPAFTGTVESADITASGIFRSPQTTLTISGGQVAVTRNNHTLEPESGTTDDLDGMSGGNQGMLCIISNQTGGDTITVRDATGSNQFDLSTAGNFSMDSTFDILTVIYRGTGTSRVWLEVARSSNV